MKKQDYFDKEKARTYDSKFSKISPIKDALHLLTQLVFSDVPDNIRMLCVGAGTGAELLYLAKHFPNWEFDIVEPSEPMLKVCIEQCQSLGVDSRCNFHLGGLDSFKSDEKFEVATSFLVSHFISDIKERLTFFEQINGYLNEGGILVNADISGDIKSSHFKRTLKVWRECLLYSGMPEEEANKLCSSLKNDLGVIKPLDLEDLLKEAGFENPTLFFQAFFIHGWFSRRTLKK